MTTVLVLPENDSIWKFIQGLHGFILNWTFFNFLDFCEKNPWKKKKVCINNFDEHEKPWTYLKKFQKKKTNFKAIGAVLGYSKPKIFFVGQWWYPTCFQDLGSPQLFYRCYGPAMIITNSMITYTIL